MKKEMENTDRNKKHRSTFAILFYINRTKIRKDGTCQLLCKVSIDAEWEQIGTKVSVNPSIWNPEKGRADGRSENAVVVNRAIDELAKEITGHYNNIKNSLGFITAELVKNAVMGIGQKPLTLLALFREHNEEFEKRIGLDRIKETHDSYLRSYKHLAAFIKEKKGVEDVTLRSLDKVFYDDFELFLCKDCGMKPKTVHEHLYRLKKMTRRAVSQGAARSGILLFHPRIFHKPGNDFQRIDSLVQFGNGLFYFLRYGSQYNLPRTLRVPEINPIKRCLVTTVILDGHGFQHVPQVEP